MTAALTILDQTAAGHTTGQTVLEFLTESITLRELIRSRVYQEVQDYNRQKPEYFKGLVEPTDAERTLNGSRLRNDREVDWKLQFDQACKAFERNGFFVLIDDRQAESLDDQIMLRTGTSVSFVKLTPLVGG